MNIPWVLVVLKGWRKKKKKKSENFNCNKNPGGDLIFFLTEAKEIKFRSNEKKFMSINFYRSALRPSLTQNVHITSVNDANGVGGGAG